VKVRKSTIAILITVVALIVLVVALAVVNRSQSGEQVADGSLRLIAGETQLREYSYDEICAFPSVGIDKTISSSKGEDESGIFTGVPLELLLDDAESDWRNLYSEFIFHTADGFVASVFASDVEKGENVLVVFEKDGEPLKGSDEGGKGPLRVVVVDDPFGNRSAYLLTSIEAR
jgi:DMSO/TMAO reductase YedYZ molybdopterin-dependent catalytic subunit